MAYKTSQWLNLKTAYVNDENNKNILILFCNRIRKKCVNEFVTDSTDCLINSCFIYFSSTHVQE